jgi:hypothetical protein
LVLIFFLQLQNALQGSLFHFIDAPKTDSIFALQALFSELEASARTVLPQNRHCVKSYIKTSGLSELWLIVNSLTPDGLAHRAAHQVPEMEPLNALRVELMHKETGHLRSRLERIQYQLESPETACLSFSQRIGDY